MDAIRKNTAIIDANGETVGRDPREMTVSELNAIGHFRQPLRKVIRAKCLDCCCGQQSEVRKCTAVACALWPYRMNRNVFWNDGGDDMESESPE